MYFSISSWLLNVWCLYCLCDYFWFTLEFFLMRIHTSSISSWLLNVWLLNPHLVNWSPFMLHHFQDLLFFSDKIRWPSSSSWCIAVPSLELWAYLPFSFIVGFETHLHLVVCAESFCVVHFSVQVLCHIISLNWITQQGCE
jgi:hypothetical protein